MKIYVDWSRPIKLRDATKQNMIYGVDLKKIPNKTPGIYVFGRSWGRQFEALYVGQATNLYHRVRGQLNNLRLMQHIKNAKTGKRVVLAGSLRGRPGQRLKKTLDLLERATLRFFLSEGHDLVNKQGTRLRRHEVLSEGRRPRQFLPRLMYLEKGRGE